MAGHPNLITQSMKIVMPMEPIYALIEMHGPELASLRVITDRRQAVLAFNAAYDQSRLQPHDITELSAELPGTIAFAGDDAHSIQIVARIPEHAEPRQHGKR
jgi:hypothetical protein